MKKAEIDYVFDGDSFRINVPNQIRLAGINATEHGEQFSEEAKNLLTTLLPRGTNIKFDIYSFDRYGRMICAVWNSDHVLINEEMVRNGLAYVFYRYLDILPADIQTRLINAEKFAKSNHLNLWSL